MSRVLVGSSNVYKNYRVTTFKSFKEYSMVRCVNIESFDAVMDDCEDDESEVLISVLENFVDKAGKGIKDDKQRLISIEAMIKEYVGRIEAAAKKSPGSRYVLVDPILRPKLPWYDKSLDIIKNLVRKMVQATSLVNISMIESISRASQQFESDEVHLTQAAGKIFVGHMLEAAEEIFKAQFVNLDDDDQNPSGEADPAAGLERRVAKLENDTEERKWNDNMLFARTREEIDTMANKAKEDRIIMTGLTSSTPPPSDWDQKKIWLRELVINTIKKIKPDFDGKIGYINQGKNNGRDIPMVEAKFMSAAAAIEIRKIFAEKRKEEDGKRFGRLYLANSVSLSTRVRVDIMKAIAKKISNKSMASHVAAYSSRPVLHVREIGKPESSNRAYTFIDAVQRYGGAVSQADLEEAYRRAGSAFRGQLEQHFVVLRENRPVPERRETGGSRSAGGRDETGKGSKRARESDDTNESTSKKK